MTRSCTASANSRAWKTRTTRAAAKITPKIPWKESPASSAGRATTGNRSEKLARQKNDTKVQTFDGFQNSARSFALPPLWRLIAANPRRASPKSRFAPASLFRSAGLFLRCARISEPILPPVHLTVGAGSSVRRQPDAKQSFCAGGVENGQSILGRKNHRGKQRHCRCRGQPIFPARKCQ